MPELAEATDAARRDMVESFRLIQPVMLACYFDGSVLIENPLPGEQQGSVYARLARVLSFTATEHCSAWERRIEKLDPARMPIMKAASGNESHVWNTWKLDWWVDQGIEYPDGKRVLLIDGDTAILRPLDSVWDRDFDVAYTVRTSGRLPFNGGVLFLRMSDKVRSLLLEWKAVNARFLRSNEEHAPFRTAYAGINQASLGCILEQGGCGCNIVSLPCPEWNCVEWGGFDESVARILHVKSMLRRCTFRLPGGEQTRARLRPIIKIWEKLEARAIEAGHPFP